MKILERLALIIFSIIILVLSIITCLVIFNIIDLNNIFNFVQEMISIDTVSKTVLVISIVCILLAIKSLFFPSKIKKKQEIKTGILLENKDGRLLISKDTIENMVIGIVRSFKDVIDEQIKVNLDVNNNITIYISLLVSETAIIKELSSDIQNKIKKTIKTSTDLDVNQVNINIKNINNSREENKNVIKSNNSAKININNVKVNKENNINQISSVNKNSNSFDLDENKSKKNIVENIKEEKEVDNKEIVKDSNEKDESKINE